MPRPTRKSPQAIPVALARETRSLAAQIDRLARSLKPVKAR